MDASATEGPEIDLRQSTLDFVSESPGSFRGMGLLLRQLQGPEPNGVGQMTPITHSKAVHDAISCFLERSFGTPTV
jgi:hypothetical protein